VEGLEHEPERVPWQAGQPGLGHPVDAPVGQLDRARGRPLKPADEVQQGRLAAADDRH